MVPATTEPVVLRAVTTAGASVSGQVAVTRTVGIDHVTVDPSGARTPAAALDALAAADQVVIGPGSIDQAHKADEYIAVSQLEACSAFLGRLIAYSRA